MKKLKESSGKFEFRIQSSEFRILNFELET